MKEGSEQVAAPGRQRTWAQRNLEIVPPSVSMSKQAFQHHSPGLWNELARTWFNPMAPPAVHKAMHVSKRFPHVSRKKRAGRCVVNDKVAMTTP